MFLLRNPTTVERKTTIIWISKYDFLLARNQNTLMPYGKIPGTEDQRAAQVRALRGELQSFLICLFFVYSSRLGLVSKSTFLTVSP